jgi:predicted DNA-binding protein (MmcQ/YjbR family)
MDIESLRLYCLAKPATTEGLPFGEDTLVFKVAGKMFALTGLEAIPPSVNLKCDPQRAIELRDRYLAVAPGYHMNKRHWNTVSMESDVDDDLLRELIDHSYALVTRSLPKKVRENLDNYPDTAGKA